ncbi:hypothetical protein [Hymenobacter rigui]|uniref:Uncharacterized protein n=1 Tax=Hymenobacter rigui TaxID=334424 RepID=A0A428K9C4_9BACT|nr:hypothetical protein [Hymenobacter rigui]RSK43069.1 hypothetical protein EI291_22475 [Hymenobacter rigui]
MSSTLIAELNTIIQQTVSYLNPTPVNQFAPTYLRECLVQVPVSGPLPNEWTAWCYARRSHNAVFELHPDLREVAQANGLDAYELAGVLSTMCGSLYYSDLKGEWTEAERQLAAKMQNEMGGDWIKLGSGHRED